MNGPLEDEGNNKTTFKTNKQESTTTQVKQTKTKPTTKTKPAERKKNQTTEKRSLNQPDIKLFLEKKKLEARAAAKIQPTQVRIKFNQPSKIATSARSMPEDEPGGSMQQ